MEMCQSLNGTGVSNFDTSGVVDMARMFCGATSFNQDLCDWQDTFPYIAYNDIFTNSGCTIKIHLMKQLSNDHFVLLIANPNNQYITYTCITNNHISFKNFVQFLFHCIYILLCTWCISIIHIPQCSQYFLYRHPCHLTHFGCTQCKLFFCVITTY